MDYRSFAAAIKRKGARLRLRFDEPMANHTSIRIGGPADVYALPQDADALRTGLAICREAGIPHWVIGRGSNLLVSDAGLRGVVFSLSEMKNIRVEGSEIVADAGATLSTLAQTAAAAGLTGLEFASGIPGSCGGAIYMNAGAYGGEVKDVLLWAFVLDPETLLVDCVEAKDLQMGYRSSLLQQTGGLVVSARFALEPGDRTQIQARMDELAKARRAKQPLEFPSAGSAFKRPEGYFAAKLIEDAGLKGLRIGDAQVSEKHSGFIVNRGLATAADVNTLMNTVQQRVEEAFGVRLEPEIRRMGVFE